MMLRCWSHECCHTPTWVVERHEDEMVHVRVVPVQHVRHDVVRVRLELHVVVVHGPRRVEHERQATIRASVPSHSHRRGQAADCHCRDGPPPPADVVHPLSGNKDDRAENHASAFGNPPTTIVEFSLFFFFLFISESFYYLFRVRSPKKWSWRYRVLDLRRRHEWPTTSLPWTIRSDVEMSAVVVCEQYS